MLNAHTGRPYTAGELAAILDGAKARAEQARSDAQVAFWKEVSARLRRAWSRRFASRGALFARPVDRSCLHPTR
jgi:hypothetical protein